MPRPSLPRDQRVTARYTFNIPECRRAELDDLAQSQGAPVAQVIRNLVLRRLDELKSEERSAS